MNPDKELPLLAGIAGIIRWVESLVNLLSGPALTLALLVAVMDLAVHGSLLSQFPWLLIAWSACVAVGLDSQVIQAWDHVGTTFREQRWGVLFGYVVIGLLLSYVGFIAAAVFGLQHSLGLTEVQALAQMGVNAQAYQYERAGLALLLVALSAINRYHPKQRTLADKKAELTEQLELLPLQQQVQTLRATGAVNVARAVGSAAVGRQATAKQPMATKVTEDNTVKDDAPILRLKAKRAPTVAQSATEKAIRRALLRDNTLGKRQLSRLVGVSEATAGRYKAKIEREAEQSAEAQVAQ